jgi:hypothetical protein
MRCRCCGARARLLRRRCDDCETLLAVYANCRGELGPSELLDRFIATGVTRTKIEAVLASDPDGTGALRDRITADMANRLLADMGLPARQTASDVRRIRERGGGGASTARPAGDAAPPANVRRCTAARGEGGRS